jgi:RNA polymerase primary sigma factor
MSEFDTQLDRIEWLMEEAEEQGYLLLEQIIEAFPEAEDNLAGLEDLFADLQEAGVSVYDSEEEAEAILVEEDIETRSSDDEEEPFILSNISPQNVTSLYFKEMGREPLLTREEEIELAKRMERGQEAQEKLAQNGHKAEERAELERLVQDGKAARRHLIEANTRLVVSIAKRYRGQGVAFLDLIQAGNEGLITAADKFDYHRGNKFGTYATWWIRQSVTRMLKNQCRTVRIPVHTNDRIKRLYRVVQQLEQDLGCRPTPEEIAEEMDLEPDKVRWLLQVSRRSYSLDKPMGEEGDSTFGDLIENDDVPPPTQTAELNILREELEEALSSLTPREARVLRMRFGLGGRETRTLRYIGKKLGVTRERIRQIEAKGLRKLRHPRHRRRLQAYLR